MSKAVKFKQFLRKTQINEFTENFCANFARECVVLCRNLHCWLKFYTAAGSTSSDKYHLWEMPAEVRHLDTVYVYTGCHQS